MQHSKNRGFFSSFIFIRLLVFIKGSVSGTARRKRARRGGRAQSAPHVLSLGAPGVSSLHFLEVCVLCLEAVIFS